jgi:DNA-directed RNA polymerase
MLSIASETEAPDKNHHKNGVAPNMVHSLDGSHMSLVALAGHQEGMSLAMIHDDFGVHAADAERFAKIIRETFVAMYENHSPLQDLADAYDLPAPPKLGRLDLRQVLNSLYFFA